MAKIVLFRADGNAQIGLGHVMRCLALADMLGASYERRFAIVQPAPEIIQLIEEKGLAVIELDHSDVNEFVTAITSDDVVVLDGYSFDENYQRAVRAKAKKLVYIDDLVTGYQVADVLVNHAGGINKDDYLSAPYTQLMLGPHYSLLRTEFFSNHEPAPVEGPLFVSLGGADPQNTSLAVLEAIRQVDALLPVRIVLGPFHPNRPAIEDFSSQLSNLTILQNLSAGQMVTELAQCSLAITACSTIAYEVCAVNRPLITVVTADNQARLAQFLADKKLALSVNFPTLLSRLTPSMSLETALKLAIQLFQFSPETITDTLRNQRQFFDGRSPERFRALFDRLCSPTA